jgi:hypothetical protein
VPSPEVERDARARGDVPRGRLAPMAGALVGAAIAIELGAGRAAAQVATLAADALALRGEPGALLSAVVPRVGALVLPLMVGTFAGALLLGLLQTRAFVGRPNLAEPPERAAPPTPLALLGWLALALLLLGLLRPAGGLMVPADALPLARAAATVARGIGRAFLVGAAALAAIDHLLRTRARAARLEAVLRRPGPAPAAETESPMIETLLAGVERVAFDTDVAVTLGRRAGTWRAFARSHGLNARALVDAARRRRLPVHAAPGTTLEALALGAPLEPAELAALRLEAAS